MRGQQAVNGTPGISWHRRILGAAIAAAVIAGGALLGPSAANAATPLSTAVARILADTNALRAAGGLAPLVENSAMDAVAQNWSAQMDANGALTHNPSYSSQIPSGWTSAGENIASGYSYDTVVAAWHGSAGHYANIMGNYTDIGIGFVELNGATYITQDFGRYPGHVTSPTPAAPPPAAAPAAPASPAARPAAPPAAAPSSVAPQTPVPPAGSMPVGAAPHDATPPPHAAVAVPSESCLRCGLHQRRIAKGFARMFRTVSPMSPPQRHVPPRAAPR